MDAGGNKGDPINAFPTAATGWIGWAIARPLFDAGHSVTGLVRSEDKASALDRSGVTPVIEGLKDRQILWEGTDGADGATQTAFGQDVSTCDARSRKHRDAVETFAEVHSGSDRPIAVTSGLDKLTDGERFTEDARAAIIPYYSRASEQTAFALAERDVRASVVRPARSVQGPGERHGFVPLLGKIARERGSPLMSATE